MFILKNHVDEFPWQRGRLWHHLHDYDGCKIGEIQMHRMHELTRWITWLFIPITWSFWNMTFFYIKLKAFAMFKVHLMSWTIISQLPLVVILNWWEEKCVAKASWNWKHKVQLVCQCNVSPTTIGWTLPKGLVMAKRKDAPRTHAIQGGMWPLVIWKQNKNNWRNPLIEYFGWKQCQRCLKTIPEWPLLIDGACVKMQV
jgi:hypothetical protein